MVKVAASKVPSSVPLSSTVTVEPEAMTLRGPVVGVGRVTVADPAVALMSPPTLEKVVVCVPLLAVEAEVIGSARVVTLIVPDEKVSVVSEVEAVSLPVKVTFCEESVLNATVDDEAEPSIVA